MESQITQTWEFSARESMSSLHLRYRVNCYRPLLRAPVTEGAFHLTENSGKTGTNDTEISWESFPGNPKIVEFLNSKLFNRKFREENQMERKFTVRNFRKFQHTSHVCPLFQKFCKMMFHSSLNIPPNLNWKFFIVWKAPRIPWVCASQVTWHFNRIYEYVNDQMKEQFFLNKDRMSWNKE